MTALPVVSGREVIRALERAGFVVDRRRGSHVILRDPSPPFRRVVVPDHREVARGTLRAIVRSTGMTVEGFRELLKP